MNKQFKAYLPSAFLASAAIIPIPISILFTLITGLVNGVGFPDIMAAPLSGFFVGIFAFIIAFPFVLFVCIPTYNALNKYEKNSYLNFLAIIGLPLILVTSITQPMIPETLVLLACIYLVISSTYVVLSKVGKQN